MTTHALIIGANGRGHIASIHALAHEWNAEVVSVWVEDNMILDGQTTRLAVARADRFTKPTVVVLEGIDNVTTQCLTEIVQNLSDWSQENPNLPVTFYWPIIGGGQARSIELMEILYPLVSVG